MTEGVIYKAMSGFYYVKPSRLDVVKPSRLDVVKPSRLDVVNPDTSDVGVYAHNVPQDGLICCTARGLFRHKKSSPLVGDRVIYTETEPEKGIIRDILPRRNEFIRPPLANVEKMIIVASKAIPVTDPFLIDKMTVIALKNNCSPVICINKLDINEADDLSGIYMTTGFPVVKTSAVTGEGIEKLISLIKGSQCAFCGNSGVGKSSILNAISPDFDILTGDVSNKLGRGRHTTRHIQLYELAGGAVVADTPGFSAFDTGHIADKEEMQNLFPEFQPFLGQCRFDDCAHLSEPGCAVLGAAEQGIIHKNRHESYVRLYKQAAEHKSWE